MEYGGRVGDFYRAHLRSFFKTELGEQRFKLIYDVWGYWPILKSRHLTFKERIFLLFKFVRIDWALLIGSKPEEIAPVVLEIAKGGTRPRAAIEAGCWKGATTAKLSLICKLRGYTLHVYDSFQGVPEWNFAYSAAETEVRDNIRRYGDLAVCTFHPGWFKDTFREPIRYPVNVVYIDCDTQAGSKAVLSGVVKQLHPDGVIYTQDYDPDLAQKLFDDPATWEELGASPPTITPVKGYVARIRF